MKTAFLLLAVAALFIGCPKATPQNVAGSDDDQMDLLGSQLEELRTRQNVTCPEWCVLKDKVCGLSKQACDIANRKSDRSDFQQRCATSMEDCARFNDGCGTCR